MASSRLRRSLKKIACKDLEKLIISAASRDFESDKSRALTTLVPFKLEFGARVAQRFPEAAQQ